MKKLISFIIIFTFILSLSTVSIFATVDENSGYTNLDKYINENGYFEEYGSHYYFSTGYNPKTPDIKAHSEIVIYLTKGASDSVKNKLKKICSDFDVVSFKDCTYSYIFYIDLIQQIENQPEMFGKVWRYSVSSGANDTYLYMNVHTQYEQEVKAFLTKSYSQYLGNLDVHYVNPGDFTGTPEMGSEIILAAGNYPIPQSNNSNYTIFIIIGAAVLLVAGSIATVVIVQNKKRLMTTSNITVDGESIDPTIKSIKDGEEPSDDLYNKIVDKL